MATALFLLDAALDAVMLLIAARMENRWIRPWRLMLGALTGAGAAWMTRLLALPRGQAVMLWPLTAYGMMIAAQGKRAIDHPVRSVCLLLCAAGLLGGTITALHGAMGSLCTAYAAGGVCMAVMIANLIRAKNAAMDVKSIQITCSYRGRVVKFEAMIDSGNTLRDYLTHYPVIVLPQETGESLFGLQGKMLRPIFADTAGGRQMMSVFVPEETSFFKKGKIRRIAAAVALSGALSKEAPALMPASLLEGE